MLNRELLNQGEGDKLVRFHSFPVYVWPAFGRSGKLRTAASDDVITICFTDGSDVAASIIALEMLMQGNSIALALSSGLKSSVQ